MLECPNACISSLVIISIELSESNTVVSLNDGVMTISFNFESANNKLLINKLK